jgi:hypothetical protein
MDIKACAAELGNTMASLLVGFLGGMISWLATTFLASPVAELLKLRTEAGTVLAKFEDFDRFDPEKDEPDQQFKIARAEALQSCGSRLVGFALSNQCTSRIARRLKFRLADAGNELIILSGLRAYGEENEMMRQRIYQSLKLGSKVGGTNERW